MLSTLTPLCDFIIQSQGGHHHPTEDAVLGSWEDHPGHAEHSEDLDAVWKGLTALAGVYFMFLIEHFLTLGKIYKDKKQKVSETFRGLPSSVVSMATLSYLKGCVCVCVCALTLCRFRGSGIRRTNWIQRSSRLWRRTT